MKRNLTVFLFVVLATSMLFLNPKHGTADPALLTVIGYPDYEEYTGSYTITESDVIQAGGGSTGSFVGQIDVGYCMPYWWAYLVVVRKNSTIVYYNNELFEGTNDQFYVSASAGDVIEISVAQGWWSCFDCSDDCNPPYSATCTAILGY